MSRPSNWRSLSQSVHVINLGIEWGNQYVGITITPVEKVWNHMQSALNSNRRHDLQSHIVENKNGHKAVSR